MSLKRRTKIQHSPSPNTLIRKQIDEDLRLNAQIQVNKENSTEQYLLKKMQQKIGKILMAYQKLQNESKRKDEIIKELEKQILLLKQRLVERNSEKNQSMFEAKNYTQKQPMQEHVIQRTFTPLDIKKQQKISSQQLTYKPADFLTNPAVSIIREYDSRIQTNRLLRESRSHENLNKTAVLSSRNQFNYVPLGQVNDEENKIFSRRDQNRSYGDHLEEDKSFVDVLGKLKEKIRRFDEQEHAQNTKKTTEKEETFIADRINTGLQKVKSSQSIGRRQFSFMDKPQQVQTQKLKKIWNQRDEEIKRMDELFSKIDERINVIEKQ